MASNCTIFILPEEVSIFKRELELLNPNLSMSEENQDNNTILIEIDFEDDKVHTTFLEIIRKHNIGFKKSNQETDL